MSVVNFVTVIKKSDNEVMTKRVSDKSEILENTWEYGWVKAQDFISFSWLRFPACSRRDPIKGKVGHVDTVLAYIKIQKIAVNMQNKQNFRDISSARWLCERPIIFFILNTTPASRGGTGNSRSWWNFNLPAHTDIAVYSWMFLG